MTRLSWIAADWGNAALRLWLMDDAGAVWRRIDADHPGGDPEQALLSLAGADLPAEGPIPVIVCGGPAGQTAAPLVAVPCRPATAARALRLPTGDPRLAVYLLPGLRQQQPVDVMRGPETTAAGFLLRDPEFDGVLCMTGPQTVWAHVSAGEVVSFRSFMTQDLLGVVSSHPLLRDKIASTGWEDGAFQSALAQAMSRPAALAADLFALRAEAEIAGLSPQAARARACGLLIGAELAAARPWWLGQQVVILGSGEIAAAYRAALTAQGVPVQVADGENATLEGLRVARAAIVRA